MFRWLAGRGASPRETARELARIPDSAWLEALGAHHFLSGLSAEESAALRQRVAWLLASKSFTGVHGLIISDQIRLSIAVQAALPVLHLDLAVYEGWTEIVVYPGGFLIPRTDVDENGVVHEYVQEASGEAWEGGPVILSWEDSSGGLADGTNVVIHEFAHKLDLYAGEADGMPSLSAHRELAPARWRQVLDDAFDRFERALTLVEEAIPADVDPESQEGAAWFDTLPLDPYAATDKAEFFAVSSEAFFVDPAPLASALPEWYGLLALYYRQDTVLRLASGATR